MVSMCVYHVGLRFNKFGSNSFGESGLFRLLLLENILRTIERFTFFFQMILTAKRDNNSVLELVRAREA